VRILWHSNAPWIGTGYGQQTATWLPRIAALGHEITVSGPFSFAGSPMGWNGFTVLPGSQDPFGNDIIAGHYNYMKADLLITLADVFMMDPNVLQGLNVAHWLPVDCNPMGEMDAERVRALSPQIIAMSRFGQRMMQDAGFNPMYVPHGIDVQEFKPPLNKAKLRAELGFDPEMFLVGLNAANKEGPRKGIAEQMQAFAEFHEEHPGSKLLIHSNGQPKGGLDIRCIAEHLGILNDIMLPDQYALACGLMGRQMMANWYGTLDVLMNCAYGEGFGLPVIEAQACGVPVITTDWSSMTELCGSGWKVTGEKYWVPGHNSWWMRPSIQQMAHCLTMAWEHTQNGKILPMQRAAREFSMQYDADAVLTKFWKPVLDELEDRRPKVTILDLAARKQVLAVTGDARRDMLLIVPSRGRPESVRRFTEAVKATSEAQTDIIFGFDDDDPSLQDCIREAESTPYRTGPRMNQIEWTNVLALEHADDYRVLVCLGDDHVPRTPGFDTQLLLALDAGNIIAYPNDLVRDDIPEVMAVRSEAVKALGWLVMPELKHYFCDNVWADLGKHGKVIAYLPDVIVEHMHHLRVKEVERDATYRDSEHSFMHDKNEYEKWRAQRLPDDLKKIKTAVKTPALAALGD
jgi:glycosyltransferase involved in cell wall biosynthesis